MTQRETTTTQDTETRIRTLREAARTLRDLQGVIATNTEMLYQLAEKSSAAGHLEVARMHEGAAINLSEKRARAHRLAAELDEMGWQEREQKKPWHGLDGSNAPAPPQYRVVSGEGLSPEETFGLPRDHDALLSLPEAVDVLSHALDYIGTVVEEETESESEAWRMAGKHPESEERYDATARAHRAHAYEGRILSGVLSTLRTMLRAGMTKPEYIELKALERDRKQAELVDGDLSDGLIARYEGITRPTTKSVRPAFATEKRWIPCKNRLQFASAASMENGEITNHDLTDEDRERLRRELC